MALLALLIASFGCATPSVEAEFDEVIQTPMSGVDLDDSEWARNFPAAADLAILLDTTDKPVLDFGARTDEGERFLPASWLNTCLLYTSPSPRD